MTKNKPLVSFSMSRFQPSLKGSYVKQISAELPWWRRAGEPILLPPPSRVAHPVPSMWVRVTGRPQSKPNYPIPWLCVILNEFQPLCSQVPHPWDEERLCSLPPYNFPSLPSSCPWSLAEPWELHIWPSSWAKIVLFPYPTRGQNFRGNYMILYLVL